LPYVECDSKDSLRFLHEVKLFDFTLTVLLSLLCLSGELFSVLDDSRDLLFDTSYEGIDIIYKALIDILCN
jgi:hypothetical protein